MKKRQAFTKEIKLEAIRLLETADKKKVQSRLPPTSRTSLI